jgi:molecular chaperone DnaJ
MLVLGGELPLETLYGQDSIRIAPGTPGDKVVKLSNAGVPRLRGSGRGDLYLHLRVAVPTKLSEEQRSLVRSLMQSLGPDGQAPEDEGFLAKVFGSEKGKKKKKR